MNTTTVTIAKPRELERLLTLAFGGLAVVAQHGHVDLRGQQYALQASSGPGLPGYGHRVGPALLGDRRSRPSDAGARVLAG
jgi:hypothetical protein